MDYVVHVHVNLAQDVVVVAAATAMMAAVVADAVAAALADTFHIGLVFTHLVRLSHCTLPHFANHL